MCLRTPYGNRSSKGKIEATAKTIAQQIEFITKARRDSCGRDFCDIIASMSMLEVASEKHLFSFWSAIRFVYLSCFVTKIYSHVRMCFQTWRAILTQNLSVWKIYQRQAVSKRLS